MIMFFFQSLQGILILIISFTMNFLIQMPHATIIMSSCLGQAT
jgi:hypothetical protein